MNVLGRNGVKLRNLSARVAVTAFASVVLQGLAVRQLWAADHQTGAAPAGGTVINLNLNFPPTQIGNSAVIADYSCFWVTPGTCDSTGSVAGFTVVPYFAATNNRLVNTVAECTPGSSGTPYQFGTVFGPNKLLCTDFVFTPAVLGAVTQTIVETDSGGITNWICSGTGLQTCPQITLSQLPNGDAGALYNQMITASGGSGSFTYQHTGGTLPTGLSLTTGGLLSGFPSTSGRFTFTITATDVSTGCTGSRSYLILISCPNIQVEPTGALPAGKVGVQYPAVTISAHGGQPPDHFSGSLPSGLTLIPAASSSAQIVGTPQTAGDFQFTINVTDAAGCTGSAAYTLVVASNCPSTSEPQALTLEPVDAHGNPIEGGPVTYVDYLAGQWLKPSSGTQPFSYEWWINGDQSHTQTNDLEVSIPPFAASHSVQGGPPIELHVRATSECGSAAENQSNPYSPAAPSASFDAPVVSPNTVQVTDNSGPQATSWLWLWGDGSVNLDTDTLQSPPAHTYSTANEYTIVLIATNGAGSNQHECRLDVGVPNQNPCKASGATGTAPGIKRDVVVRDFDVTLPARQKLDEVSLTGSGEKWLRLSTSQSSKDKIIYLRFLDTDGNAIVERRLVMSAVQTDAVYNIEAFGAVGEYTLELVTDDAVAATLIDTAPLNRVNPPKGTREVGR